MMNAQMEPTYKTEPNEKPPLTKCQELVEEYLNEKLTNVKYEDIPRAAELST